MAKAPGESKIPVGGIGGGGGGIPILKSTKGAVKKTLLESGACRALPVTKSKLMKPIKRLIDNKKHSEESNENEIKANDATFDKTANKNDDNATYDKIDPEKTFEVCVDNEPKQTKDAKERCNVEKSTVELHRTLNVSGKIREFRKRLQEINNKSSSPMHRIRQQHHYEDAKDETVVVDSSGPHSLLVGLKDPGDDSSALEFKDDPQMIDDITQISLVAETTLNSLEIGKMSLGDMRNSLPLIEDEAMPSLMAEMTLNSMVSEVQSLSPNQKESKSISFIDDESMPSLMADANLYSITSEVLSPENRNKNVPADDKRMSTVISEKRNEQEFTSSPLEVEISFRRSAGMSTPNPNQNIEDSNKTVTLQHQQKVVTTYQHNSVEDDRRIEVKEYKLPTCKKVQQCVSKDYENKQFVLQPLTRKQNPPQTVIVTADDVKPKTLVEVKVAVNNLLSPTSADSSIQDLVKQNSFDDSLGILTPEQMDSLSFLENVLSPSTDDFVGLQNSDKTTERTNSSTPQTPTEIMKSLTPDGIQALTNKSEEEVDVSSRNPNLTDDVLVVSGSILENATVSADEINDHDDTYELFVQRPFKSSTVENLNDGNELCLSVVSSHRHNTTTIMDDELLPSVHSSILDALSSIVDTTRFDNIQHGVRMDQTPSPEELPLDPIDVKSSDLSAALSTDPKTDPSKSVTYSITSITSLDGYQGDGEMSRPVSRGADQSPTIGHRGVNNIQNWQNIPISRRQDPMTDSDFFTESDADGHDEQVHRRAQVIDGALYGGGKNCNPPVLVSRNGNSNNDDSCMESSGVFTDVETHRCSPMLLNVIDDLSPEGCTVSTRSDLSQNNTAEMQNHSDSLEKTVVACNNSSLDSRPENKESNKLTASDKSNNSADGSFSSPNRSNEKINKEDKNMAIKKYKMPRRDVASKVKTMLMLNNKPLPEGHESKTTHRKEGRWDAVMNKISVNKNESKLKSSLKDVKPKVRTCQDKSAGFDDSTSPNKQKAKMSKSRRGKSRMPVDTAGSSSRSTPHSSQSDLSVSSSIPLKTTTKHSVTRAAKKRDGPGRALSPQGGVATPPTSLAPGAYAPSRNRTPPATNGRQQPPPPPLVKKPSTISSLATRESPSSQTQVTNGTVTTNNNHHHALTKNSIPSRKPIARRAVTQLSPRVQPLKEQNRPSSPVSVLKAPPRTGTAPLAPPAPLPPPAPPVRDVEALAVLIQYLVFQLDALNAPRWKVQATEAKLQLTEVAKRLQRALVTQRTDNDTITKNLHKISELEILLKSKDEFILATTAASENKYKTALEESSMLAEELKSLKKTLHELKTEVKESKARILEAENANQRYKAERITIESKLSAKIKENELLKSTQKQELEIPPSPGKNKLSEDIAIKAQKEKENELAAEVESLKSVLDMKMSENSELRKKCEERTSAAEQLQSYIQKVHSLSAKVEDLSSQLEHKSQEELHLKQKCKLLEESLTREASTKNKLSQHNEELRYKLRQNTEVVNYLASFSGVNQRCSVTDGAVNVLNLSEGNFIRGQPRTTASFNDKLLNKLNTSDRRSNWRSGLRRTTLSDSNDKHCTPNKSSSSLPSSPKVKGIVEKDFSLSYVLEIEESPEEIASRLVRRASSFRASASLPHTREAIKRQRSRPKTILTTSPHSLAQSASASSIEPIQSAHSKLFRSNSNEFNQFDPVRQSTPNKKRPNHITSISFDSTEIKLSEQSHNKNGELLLSDCDLLPKEAAGEALISGANSEDDSSLDERSQSSSDSESCSDFDKHLHINKMERVADPLLQKIADTMNQSLSATPMDVSWSDDGVNLLPKNDM